jgi:hypothetical protein
MRMPDHAGNRMIQLADGKVMCKDCEQISSARHPALPHAHMVRISTQRASVVEPDDQIQYVCRICGHEWRCEKRLKT